MNRLRSFICRTGLVIASVFFINGTLSASLHPKREFRGAWMNTIYQPQYKANSTEANKKYLCRQLDSLSLAGVNAVIFQVRPQADAFYESRLEPWSRFLTDGGKAPSPYWDPLEFMVGECHARGMELHAWLNPYRVTSAAGQQLPPGHIYHKHPERFVRYGGKLYFDPGIPENRDFIVAIVKDIVSRYDVDGIHFDDYFYPYPIKGVDFPDKKSYARYGKKMKRDDWRRHNVDLLVRDVHNAIDATKPWVRFGISPFGIWRNRKSDPRGSETSGLENFDALYADVLLWASEGWVDYIAPQLYWELDHKAASYRTLIDWWNRNADGCQLYIGQDVERSVKAGELDSKMSLLRASGNVEGLCWWPAYSITRNVGGGADSLACVHHAVKALPPSFPYKCGHDPEAPSGMRIEGGSQISWDKPAASGASTDVNRHVIYRFDTSAEVDISRPEAIVAVTYSGNWNVEAPGCYVVTALDRANNESGPSEIVNVWKRR